jgi:hypothetical protein
MYVCNISLPQIIMFPSHFCFPLIKIIAFGPLKSGFCLPALNFNAYEKAVLGPLQKREAHFFTAQCSALSASQALQKCATEINFFSPLQKAVAQRWQPLLSAQQSGFPNRCAFRFATLSSAKWLHH